MNVRKAGQSENMRQVKENAEELLAEFGHTWDRTMYGRWELAFDK